MYDAVETAERDLQHEIRRLRGLAELSTRGTGQPRTVLVTPKLRALLNHLEDAERAAGIRHVTRPHNNRSLGPEYLISTHTPRTGRLYLARHGTAGVVTRDRRHARRIHGRDLANATVGMLNREAAPLLAHIGVDDVRFEVELADAH